MKRSALVVTLSLVAASAWAAEPVDWEVVTRIRHEGLQRSQVMQTLRHLTDEIGPRLTGSPALREANEWTRDRLAGWGLENAHLEEWGPFGRGWSFSRTSVHMVSPRATPLHALPLAWSAGTEGPVRGPASIVQIESEADFGRYQGRLTGHVVLLDEPQPVSSGDRPAVRRLTSADLEERTRVAISTVADAGRAAIIEKRKETLEFLDTRHAFLRDEGVVATLQVSSLDSGLVHRAFWGLPDSPSGLPGLVMTLEHYNLLHRLLSPPDGLAPQEVGLEIDVATEFHDETTSAFNTIAEIPGREPDAGVVLLGAHLDSWHTGSGATDDAVGCAVMMEAVRILKAIGARPLRTVRVALWSGEEQDLLGSRAHVARHYAELRYADPGAAPWLRLPVGRPVPRPAHSGLSAYFNLDGGGGRIRGIVTQGNAGVVPIFRAWLEPLRDLGAVTVTQRDTLGNSDHIAFDEVGLPGFHLIQDGLDYQSRTHHSHVDTYDHTRAEDLMQASVVIASLAWHAAERADRLPREPMPEYPEAAPKTEPVAGAETHGR